MTQEELKPYKQLTKELGESAADAILELIDTKAGFAKIESKLDRLEALFDKADDKFDKVNERILELHKKIDSNFKISMTTLLVVGGTVIGLLLKIIADH